jgi:hypothetical protein
MLWYRAHGATRYKATSRALNRMGRELPAGRQGSPSPVVGPRIKRGGAGPASGDLALLA